MAPEPKEPMSSIRSLSRRAFSETSDPEAYLPRQATENAMREIGAWADSDDQGSTLAALIGTPGLGKTMLLRLIERRAVRTSDRPAALYLPYAGLAPQDLCLWVYGLLGEPLSAEQVADSAAAFDRLLEIGEAENPFFLLLDDADSIPAETIEGLLERVPADHSPLRLLLALNPDSKATRLLSLLHPLSPATFTLRERMSDEEVLEYLRGRMRWAGFPQAEINAIDEEEARRLNALAAGIPRQLHRLALFRFDDSDAALSPDLIDKQMREDWMGRPLEDEPEDELED